MGDDPSRHETLNVAGSGNQAGIHSLRKKTMYSIFQAILDTIP